MASRSVGFTLIAALFGFGLSQDNWPLLLLAALTGTAVYLIDAFYTWRASERDAYLRDLEDVLAVYYAAIERAPNNRRELARLQRRFTALRVGTTSQIRTFRWRNALYVQPAPLFKFLYPILLMFAVITAIAIGAQDL